MSVEKLTKQTATASRKLRNENERKALNFGLLGSIGRALCAELLEEIGERLASVICLQKDGLGPNPLRERSIQLLVHASPQRSEPERSKIRHFFCDERSPAASGRNQ